MFLNDQTCFRFNKCAKLLGVNLDESLNFDTQVNEVVSSCYFHAVSEKRLGLESAGAGVLLGRPIADPSLPMLYRGGLDDVGADFAFCHLTRDGGRLKGLRSALSASFSQSSSRITRWLVPSRPHVNLQVARPPESSWQPRLLASQPPQPEASRSRTDTDQVPLLSEKSDVTRSQPSF